MSLQTPNLKAQIIAATFKRLSENFKNGQTKCKCLEMFLCHQTLTISIPSTVLADDLLQLRALFGDLLERALDILDRCNVVAVGGAGGLICFRPPTGDRCVIGVPGSQAGVVYKLLRDTNYCCCSSFRYQVLLGTQQFTCKHVLAGKLAALLGLWRIQTVTVAQFGVLIEQVVRQSTT